MSTPLAQINSSDDLNQQHLHDKAKHQRMLLGRFKDRYRDDWPEGHEQHTVCYVLREPDEPTTDAVALCSCGELLFVGETDYSSEEVVMLDCHSYDTLQQRARSKTRNAAWLIAGLLFVCILNIVCIAWIATHICH